MPSMQKLREFECKKCGEHFEELLRDEDEVPQCPKCQSDDVERVLVFPGTKGGPRSDWGV
jgi:putative FmdB family regulatory protein